MFNSPFAQQNGSMPNMELIAMQARQMMPQMQAQQTTIDKVADIISGLSQDEQVSLSMSEQFVKAKTLFDTTFLDFIQGKFKAEFMATQNGQKAAQNLLDTTSNVVGSLKERNRIEREKLARLTQLLEQNPNLLNELEAKQNGKGAK